MAARNFHACLQLTLRFEGGYSDHPADPGGATNLGVTRRTLAAFRGRPVTKTDVRNLTHDEAARIYRRLYWDVVRGDDLPEGVDAAVFDHAVNSGPRAAARMLQQALAMKPDGVVGPATLALVRLAQPAPLLRELIRRRQGFLARLKTFRIFGRGWTRRVRAIEAAALAMIAARNGNFNLQKGASK